MDWSYTHPQQSQTVMNSGDQRIQMSQMHSNTNRAELGNDSMETKDDTDWEEFRLPIHHIPTENLDRDSMVNITMDTPIPSSNVGYKLMMRMGWKEQTPLGRGSDVLMNYFKGLVDPIRINPQIGKLGLGKQEDDEHYTQNIKRKELQTEIVETVEMEKNRLQRVEIDKKRKEEVKEITKVFYCELCNKQYTKVTEWETHLSSYDHNHKKRFQEMKQMEKLRAGGNRAKKEKEKMDKEMQQIMLRAQQAQQQKQANQPTAPTFPPPPPFEAQPPQPSMDVSFQPPPPPPMDSSSFQPPPPPSTTPFSMQQSAPIKFSFSSASTNVHTQQSSGPIKFSLGGPPTKKQRQ